MTRRDMRYQYRAMLWEPLPNMRISMFVNLLLLAHSIKQVQSTNTSTPDIIQIAENTPLIAGTRCTSRTLSSIRALPGSTNVTAEEESILFPPYCPDGYFCDLEF